MPPERLISVLERASRTGARPYSATLFGACLGVVTTGSAVCFGSYGSNEHSGAAVTSSLTSHPTPLSGSPDARGLPRLPRRRC
jgi:hypothetical protein